MKIEAGQEVIYDEQLEMQVKVTYNDISLFNEGKTYLSYHICDKEEKEILFEILPEEDMHLYNARVSDLIKSKFMHKKSIK